MRTANCVQWPANDEAVGCQIKQHLTLDSHEVEAKRKRPIQSTEVSIDYAIEFHSLTRLSRFLFNYLQYIRNILRYKFILLLITYIWRSVIRNAQNEALAM